MLAGGAVSAMGRPPEGLLVPPGDSLGFRLIRHGSPIGMHTLAFRRDGANLEVHIAVDAVVKFGPIPFYRYRHHAVEVWRDGMLHQVTSRTDRNGTALEMRLRRSAQGLAAEGTGTPAYVPPEEALPTTYWNKRMLGVPLVGTQDGGLLRPNVTDRGHDTVRTATGEPLRVQRWVLSGDLDLTLLYDGTDCWAGMRLTVSDGSEVHYERL